jgi:Tfp pilus assembly protein PilX
MNTKGFSIIIAMGTIGVLLIIVVGLASTYLRELRLTRTSYDDIVAYASAEGMFEYGMLKVRNHREGFQDQVSTTDVDGKENFILTTDRSR